MLYLALKSLHILSVVLFLGNIITGVFWKVHADRTGDLRARAQALDGIIKSDRWFTVPGVLLIIATGVCDGAARASARCCARSGSSASLALFGVAGLAFGVAVGPLQKKLLANVRAGLAGNWDETRIPSAVPSVGTLGNRGDGRARWSHCSSW